MSLSTYERESFLKAAAIVLNHRTYTGQALVAAADNKDDALVLLLTYRKVFQSDTPWPDGDQETRCLALLFLIEFYS